MFFGMKKGAIYMLYVLICMFLQRDKQPEKNKSLELLTSAAFRSEKNHGPTISKIKRKKENGMMKNNNEPADQVDARQANYE
jgi:hypothetical protein